MLELVAASYVATTRPAESCSTMVPLPRWIASENVATMLASTATSRASSAGEKPTTVGTTRSPVTGGANLLLNTSPPSPRPSSHANSTPPSAVALTV